MSEKKNCYSCVHRRNIPGDAHSECFHPSISDTTYIRMMVMTATFAYGASVLKRLPELQLDVDQHAVSAGYFSFPVNFDPVWINECKGHTQNVAIPG